LARIRAVLWVYAFGVLGIFLVAAPWTPVWDQAAFVLLPVPAVGWIGSGWARGAISGLGLLNLMTAGRDAGAWWRERRPRVGGAPEKKRGRLFAPP